MSDAPPPMHSPLPPGARCAIHPERVAERTCVRCGNYMCSDCGGGRDSGICLTCESRVGPAGGGFPFSRDHYSLDGLLSLAMSRWKANWTLLLVTFGAGMMLIYGLTIAGEVVFMAIASKQGSDAPLLSPLHPVRLGFTGVVSILQLAVQLVLTGLCLDLLRGEQSSVALGLQRLRKLPAAIVQLVLMYAAIAVDFALHYALYMALGGFEAGLTPVWIVIATWFIGTPLRVYVFLGVVFAQLQLLVEPESDAFSAFAGAWRVASGHRFEVLGIGFVALVILALGVIACCVGTLMSLPIATLVYCGLFLALSNSRATP
ncbi:MAG TPA: hypothetical protein VJV78_43050 [Polyangiales bacterium]|nr:hypothetical protein [Polyangiales bacterium]